jgi:hypothetical protein
MKKLWITYAWADNEDKDIDFIINSLDATKKLEVHFDRRNLVPGQKLWTQIAGMITDPAECDAWAIVLTPNSIRSLPCQEELAYALNRALDARAAMPLIGLMHRVKALEIPTALKIRLAIRLDDPSWTGQVIAAAEQRPAGFVPDPNISMIVVKVYRHPQGYMIELRPRLDTIHHVLLGVEPSERSLVAHVNPEAAPGRFPLGFHTVSVIREGELILKRPTGESQTVFGTEFSHTNDPARCMMVIVKSLPQRVWYGTFDDLEQIELAGVPILPQPT